MARRRPDPDPPRPGNPSPLELGQAAASRIGSGDWQLDAEQPPEAEPRPASSDESGPPSAKHETRNTKYDPSPPSPEQLVEAMLFVGGHALTAETACSAVRGLTPDRFHAAIDTLNKRYRAQRRAYAIHPRDGGFVLAVHPGFRALRERLFGGPREARLGQAALDVLAVIAYRQPVGKAEIDAARGTDSGGVLRQLVRLGLVAVRHRAESGGREVRYGTTPRFLRVFGLNSLDELPRLGETQQT
ncbi:MAG TPA: SMC-Scp complex subunit ScpB [Gemmataceae bacterium]|nr:SMC-Scp complex subunit ScpB [Gemmataceae bacterium]